jgi:sterol desaturase/sphingolipid hydroxylase (fatty acid hydroxylase superfamily)
MWSAWDYTVALLVAHNGVGLVGILLSALLWKLDLFPERKLQRGKSPESWLVRKALVQYVLEAYVVFPLLGYYGLAPLLLSRAATELPGALTCVLQVVLMLLMTDLLFYCSHRALHCEQCIRSSSQLLTCALQGRRCTRQFTASTISSKASPFHALQQSSNPHWQ